MDFTSAVSLIQREYPRGDLLLSLEAMRLRAATAELSELDYAAFKSVMDGMRRLFEEKV